MTITGVVVVKGRGVPVCEMGVGEQVGHGEGDGGVIVAGGNSVAPVQAPIIKEVRINKYMDRITKHP